MLPLLYVPIPYSLLEPGVAVCCVCRSEPGLGPIPGQVAQVRLAPPSARGDLPPVSCSQSPRLGEAAPAEGRRFDLGDDIRLTDLKVEHPGGAFGGGEPGFFKDGPVRSLARPAFLRQPESRDLSEAPFSSHADAQLTDRSTDRSMSPLAQSVTEGEAPAKGSLPSADAEEVEEGSGVVQSPPPEAEDASFYGQSSPTALSGREPREPSPWPEERYSPPESFSATEYAESNASFWASQGRVFSPQKRLPFPVVEVPAGRCVQTPRAGVIERQYLVRFDPLGERRYAGWYAQEEMEVVTLCPQNTRSMVSHKYRNISHIVYHNFVVEAWYFSPYPGSYCRQSTLFICPKCLKYIKSPRAAAEHIRGCGLKTVPGIKIYDDGAIKVYEIDGRCEKLFCQCLCLLSKLFLDSKTVFYDIDIFMFYVMTVRADVLKGALETSLFDAEKQASRVAEDVGSLTSRSLGGRSSARPRGKYSRKSGAQEGPEAEAREGAEGQGGAQGAAQGAGRGVGQSAGQSASQDAAQGAGQGAGQAPGQGAGQGVMAFSRPLSVSQGWGGPGEGSPGQPCSQQCSQASSQVSSQISSQAPGQAFSALTLTSSCAPEPGASSGTWSALSPQPSVCFASPELAPFYPTAVSGGPGAPGAQGPSGVPGIPLAGSGGPAPFPRGPGAEDAVQGEGGDGALGEGFGQGLPGAVERARAAITFPNTFENEDVIVGYFSKEKMEKNILACIVTLPCFLRVGVGTLLIDFAYMLARAESRQGGPEEPLSEFGRRAFTAYWRRKILEYITEESGILDELEVEHRAWQMTRGGSAPKAGAPPGRRDALGPFSALGRPRAPRRRSPGSPGTPPRRPSPPGPPDGCARAKRAPGCERGDGSPEDPEERSPGPRAPSPPSSGQLGPETSAPRSHGKVRPPEDKSAEAYAPLFEHGERLWSLTSHRPPNSPKRASLCCKVGWQVEKFYFSIERFSEHSGILPRQAASVANMLNVLRLRGEDSAVLNNYQLREVAKMLASDEAKKSGALQRHRMSQRYLRWTIYPAMYKRKAPPPSGGE